MNKRTVLFCNCSHKDVVPDAVRREVLAGLAGSRDVDVVATPDLCGMAAERDGRLAELAKAERLTIVACRPRAVTWLLRWAGVTLDPARAQVLDMRRLSAGEVLAACGVAGAADAPGAASRPVPDVSAPAGWVPWFPVLDYDRCVNCKQCMSFCPFGVYALSAERKVEVRNPRSCKDGCPACARMCPELAIVFPKVKETPIDGAEVSGEHVAARRAAAIDEQLKKGGNIHELLAKRRQAAAMAAAAARGAAPGGRGGGARGGEPR
jgi:NAD-dependent dihydropyrimidine dehydrogenase PreA subunit